MYNFTEIGFTTSDQMLDRYNDDHKAGLVEDFSQWYGKQLVRAGGNRLLDHPSLPPVAEDDLDDGDPTVGAKLKPHPKLPTMSAMALPDGSAEDDKQLVPA